MRVLQRPTEGKIGDLFPSRLPNCVMGAPREFAVRGDRRRFLVLANVGLVDGRRDEVIVATSYEKERRALVLPVVHFRLRMRVQKGERSVPEDARRAGNLVTIVDLSGFNRVELVRERIVEL